MSESILKKTRNYFRCVGTCYEKNLKREPYEIKIKDSDGNDDGTINGERITGSVAVRTDNGVLTFRAYFQSHNSKPNKNGGHDSGNWIMAQSMMDWNPEINGNGEEPTLVNIEGTLGINDYLGNDGEVKSPIQYSISKGSTKVNESDTKGCTWEGVMYIKNISHETRNDGEETGRLVVNLIGVKNGGEVFPVKTYVEEDLADDFEDAFENEQTVNMTIDIVSKHIGGAKQTAKKAFGKAGSVAVNSGFDVTEMIIVGADDPIEEPDEEDDDGNIIDNGWLNPKTIKKALKEREKKLEEIKNNLKSSSGNSIKEKKNKMKKASPIPSDTTPFDVDDDEDELF